jgi:hypothetical protein
VHVTLGQALEQESEQEWGQESVLVLVLVSEQTSVRAWASVLEAV